MQQAPWRPQQQIYIKKKKKAFRSLRMKSKCNVISNNKQGHNNNINNNNDNNNNIKNDNYKIHNNRHLKKCQLNFYWP